MFEERFQPWYYFYLNKQINFTFFLSGIFNGICITITHEQNMWQVQEHIRNWKLVKFNYLLKLHIY